MHAKTLHLKRRTPSPRGSRRFSGALLDSGVDRTLRPAVHGQQPLDDDALQRVVTRQSASAGAESSCCSEYVVEAAFRFVRRTRSQLDAGRARARANLYDAFLFASPSGCWRCGGRRATLRRRSRRGGNGASTLALGNASAEYTADGTVLSALPPPRWLLHESALRRERGDGARTTMPPSASNQAHRWRCRAPGATRPSIPAPLVNRPSHNIFRQSGSQRCVRQPLPASPVVSAYRSECRSKRRLQLMCACPPPPPTDATSAAHSSVPATLPAAAAAAAPCFASRGVPPCSACEPAGASHLHLVRREARDICAQEERSHQPREGATKPTPPCHHHRPPPHRAPHHPAGGVARWPCEVGEVAVTEDTASGGGGTAAERRGESSASPVGARSWRRELQRRCRRCWAWRTRAVPTSGGRHPRGSREAGRAPGTTLQASRRRRRPTRATRGLRGVQRAQGRCSRRVRARCRPRSARLATLQPLQPPRRRCARQTRRSGLAADAAPQRRPQSGLRASAADGARPHGHAR